MGVINGQNIAESKVDLVYSQMNEPLEACMSWFDCPNNAGIFSTC